MATAQSIGNGQVDPTPDEVRAYLHALLGRSEFDASERNRRFLSYVVDETLEGRADRIKAYNIALAAFDRTEDFDPLTDPIVRIEASRLRRSLEHYYLTAGRVDPIRIGIPKGSYAATFTHHYDELGAPKDRPSTDNPVRPMAPEPSPTKRRGRLALALILAALLILLGAGGLFILRDSGQSTEAARGGPSILVLPFEDTGGDITRSYIARGLTYEIIGRLARFNDLFVFGSHTSFNFDDTSGTSPAQSEIKPDFVLTGSVQASGDKVRVSAILEDGETKQYLWSSSIERELTTPGLSQIQSEIAEQVAAAIARPYGSVFERSAQKIASKPAESLIAYECVVKFRQYWRSYSDRDFNGIRTCLENTVASEPSYPQGYSSLALLYVDSYRFRFGQSDRLPDPLARTLDLSNRALELDPDLPDGYLARSMALWLRHDVEGSIDAARQGLALDPHNTDLMADLGFRYALLAKWDEAMPLVKDAFARNPGAPNTYHLVTFLHAYMAGDYKAALQAALKVQTPDVVYGSIARAMAYAQLGDSVKATREAAEILRIYPNYNEQVTDDLARQNIDPTIARAIRDGLAKAGLDLRAQPNDN